MKQCTDCLAVFEDAVEQCPKDNCVLEEAQNVDPLLGTCLVDRYKIISVLGSGGMGTVYKAQHTAMDRMVAVKILHAHLASRANALIRFHEEAKTIAQLKHHNIITLYDFGISPSNQPFLVMDYVNGFSLKKFVEEVGVVPLERIDQILSQVVDGLSYAHSEGVIHRDLKPENIMLTRVDQNTFKVTLVDFGLAMLAVENNGAPTAATKNAKLFGSPFYMSPEQCLANATIDSRCDVYSLAVVIYEALSARLPYEKKSGMSMLESHLYKQALPFNLTQPGLKVCTELTRVFNQALAKEPENRHQTIGDFYADMSEALARDAVKWRAVKHRSLVARQTMTKTGSPLDQDLPTDTKYDESLFDLQFQTGQKFLSRQAEIEAALFKPENGVKTDKKESGSIEVQQKQCLYCGTMMPAGILFCLSCQRKIRVRSNKLSETYSCMSAAPLDPTNKDAEQVEQARSNIRSLRSSNLSVALAKTQRVLIYAITITLLFIFLILSNNYLDFTKSAKYIGQLVGHPANFTGSPTYYFRRKH